MSKSQWSMNTPNLLQVLFPPTCLTFSISHIYTTRLLFSLIIENAGLRLLFLLQLLLKQVLNDIVYECYLPFFPWSNMHFSGNVFILFLKNSWTECRILSWYLDSPQGLKSFHRVLESAFASDHPSFESSCSSFVFLFLCCFFNLSVFSSIVFKIYCFSLQSHGLTLIRLDMDFLKVQQGFFFISGSCLFLGNFQILSLHTHRCSPFSIHYFLEY